MRSGSNAMKSGITTCPRSAMLLAAFLILIEGNCLVSSTALAGEFHLIIHDVEGDAAAWFPREVVIHRSSDLEGGLILVLEHPTSRTHVFEAPGLFEQITVEGSEDKIVKPLRVYVAPRETVKIQVSTQHPNPERDRDGEP